MTAMTLQSSQKVLRNKVKSVFPCFLYSPDSPATEGLNKVVLGNSSLRRHQSVGRQISVIYCQLRDQNQFKCSTVRNSNTLECRTPTANVIVSLCQDDCIIDNYLDQTTINQKFRIDLACPTTKCFYFQSSLEMKYFPGLLSLLFQFSAFHCRHPSRLCEERSNFIYLLELSQDCQSAINHESSVMRHQSPLEP